MKEKVIFLSVNILVYLVLLLAFKFIFIVANPDLPPMPVPWAEAGFLAFVLWAIVFEGFFIVAAICCMVGMINNGV
jgi:hypothetical protein